MKRPAFPCAAAIVLLAAGARAEVSVELNSSSHVTKINVRNDLEAGTIWGRLSALPDNQVLNPLGDLSGDRMPTCGILALPTEDAAKHPPHLRNIPRDLPSKLRTAVVAWPQFDGNDWEIVYATWDSHTETWTATAFVAASDNTVDDIDPQLYVRGKRVILVWRRGTASDSYVLSTAELVDVGGDYQLQWDAPVEMTTPPEIPPEDPPDQGPPQLRATGATGLTQAAPVGTAAATQE